MLFNLSDIEETDLNEKEYVSNLYEEYSKTLWKYAYYLSHNMEIANDLVSNTFLKVIEKIDIIKKVHKYKIKSYLMSIVRNTYFNYLNKEKQFTYIENMPENSCSNRDSDFFDKYTLNEIEEAIKNLQEPYKAIILYRYVFDELSYKEIASILNMNINTIRVYKKRALEMLKQRMELGE